METIKIVAPAKVNLFLGIGEKREDGYHRALSIMHALAIHDTLTMLAIPAGAYAADFVRGDGYDLPTVEEQGLFVGIEAKWHEALDELSIPLDENLIAKAVFALARALDYPWKGYLRVSIDKHIPAAAGLGGGSSDAAAALVGAAHVWGVASDDPALEQAAREVGADVPFFLRGGCGVYRNRGDEFVRDLTPRKDNVALVIPEGGVSTAAAYNAFDEHPCALTAEMLKAASAAPDAASVPLFNNLAPAAETLLPELSAVRAWLLEQPGVQEALLTGSGAATYAVCENHEAALRLTVAAQQQGYRARATTFSGLRAAMVPSRR